MITTERELYRMTLRELIDLALTSDMDDRGFWTIVMYIIYRLGKRNPDVSTELIVHRETAARWPRGGAFSPSLERLAAEVLLSRLQERHAGPHEEDPPQTR